MPLFKATWYTFASGDHEEEIEAESRDMAFKIWSRRHRTGVLVSLLPMKLEVPAKSSDLREEEET